MSEAPYKYDLQVRYTDGTEEVVADFWVKDNDQGKTIENVADQMAFLFSFHEDNAIEWMRVIPRRP